MKTADLDILLQEGEGVMLEYKESLSSSFARELVAFANTAGGKILLGVGEEVRAQAGAKESPSTAQVGTKKGPGRDQVKAHDEAHDKAHETLNMVEYRLLKECIKEPQITPTLLNIFGYKTRPGGFKVALSHLLALGLLEMTVPDNPRSKKQRYRTGTPLQAAQFL